MQNKKMSLQFKRQPIRQVAQAKSHQKGVVLIEALIAILIFSFGILALVGLQAAMIKNTTDNKYRADASFIAQEQLARLWSSDHANLADAVKSINDSNKLPDGIATKLPKGEVIISQQGFLVTAEVTWTTPGGDPHRYQASSYIESNFLD